MDLAITLQCRQVGNPKAATEVQLRQSGAWFGHCCPREASKEDALSTKTNTIHSTRTNMVMCKMFVSMSSPASPRWLVRQTPFLWEPDHPSA